MQTVDRDREERKKREHGTFKEREKREEMREKEREKGEKERECTNTNTLDWFTRGRAT